MVPWSSGSVGCEWDAEWDAVVTVIADRDETPREWDRARISGDVCGAYDGSGEKIVWCRSKADMAARRLMRRAYRQVSKGRETSELDYHTDDVFPHK